MVKLPARAEHKEKWDQPQVRGECGVEGAWGTVGSNAVCGPPGKCGVNDPLDPVDPRSLAISNLLLTYRGL